MTDDDTNTTTAESSDQQLEGTIALGYHRGYLVNAHIERQPENAPAPNEFAVNVYVPNKDGKNVDIVRIDTDAEVDVHIDRLYLPEGEQNRKHDPHIRNEDSPIVTPDAALDWFLEDKRWQTFVTEYERTHGLPDKAIENVERT